MQPQNQRRKQVEVDPAKVLKWLTYDQSFVPPHISFNGSRFKKIVLLTNISKYKKNQKDFRPFGADLGTFIDFQYETTSGRVTSLFTQNIASKKAIVNVYSSPEIAFERLEEIGEKLSQTLLVCDDYRLANRFLGLMPDAWGFENLTIILIVDLHAREVQKTAAARNFLISAMHPHFDDLSHQDTQAERMISGRKSQITKQNFSDKLSMFEKKLARSCRKPDIDFMQMQNSILDRFLDLKKKSGKVKKVDPR